MCSAACCPPKRRVGTPAEAKNVLWSVSVVLFHFRGVVFCHYFQNNNLGDSAVTYWQYHAREERTIDLNIQTNHLVTRTEVLTSLISNCARSWVCSTCLSSLQPSSKKFVSLLFLYSFQFVFSVSLCSKSVPEKFIIHSFPLSIHPYT